MSRFYVGQRVRVISVKGRPSAEGVLVGFVDGSPWPWDVVVDGTEFSASTDQLRPAIPPGLESIEETLALWLPEGMAA